MANPITSIAHAPAAHPPARRADVPPAPKASSIDRIEISPGAIERANAEAEQAVRRSEAESAAERSAVRRHLSEPHAKGQAIDVRG